MSQITMQIIFICLILGIAAGSGIYAFSTMTREQKIANVKEWLKYAVVMAEKQLGSGTGQLKLRYVYNTAVNKFPWIVSFVTFEKFDLWVKEALEWMNKQIEINPAINQYIGGR